MGWNAPVLAAKLRLHPGNLHKAFCKVRLHVCWSKRLPHHHVIFVQIVLVNGHRNMANVQIPYYCVFPFCPCVVHSQDLSFLTNRGR